MASVRHRSHWSSGWLLHSFVLLEDSLCVSSGALLHEYQLRQSHRRRILIYPSVLGNACGMDAGRLMSFVFLANDKKTKLEGHSVLGGLTEDSLV